MVAKMNILHAAGLVDGYSGIAHLAPAQVPAPGVWGCAHQRLVAWKVVIIALMQNTQYDNWCPSLSLNELQTDWNVTRWVKRRLRSCNTYNCMSSTLLGRPCELCQNIFRRISRSLNIRTISQTYEVKTLWVTLFASNAVCWLSHRVSVKKIVKNKQTANYNSIELLDAHSNITLFKIGQIMVGCFTCEKWRHSLLWQKCWDFDRDCSTRALPAPPW